jgi:raffinose/stachyose/melibiose transport system permease protein
MNALKLRKNAKTGLLHIILISIAALWMYPFVWMISSSMKTHQEFIENRLSIIPNSFNLENIQRVWTGANFGTYFINTAIVTVFAVILAIMMTSMAGYALGRYKFIGRTLVIGLLIGSITLPIVTTVIPIYEIIRSMGLLGTRTGLILAQAGSGKVIFLLLFAGFFAQLPREMEDAANIDGCGFFRTFFYIMLPLSKPIVTTVIIMETIWSWNSFMVPLVLTLNAPGARTLAVGLFAFRGENVIDWTGIAAGASISILPIIILFILMQRYFVEGIAGSVKS